MKTKRPQVTIIKDGKEVKISLALWEEIIQAVEKYEDKCMCARHFEEMDSKLLVEFWGMREQFGEIGDEVGCNSSEG